MDFALRKRRISAKPILVVLSGGVVSCVLLVIVLMQVGESAAVGAPSPEVPYEHGAGRVEALAIRTLDEAQASRAALGSGQSVQADTNADLPLLPDAIQLEHLRLEIESTLVGQLDPGQFLDTALALTNLEVSDRPIPAPHVNGSMRYPILGTPKGVTAELWVKTAKSSLYDSPILTYALEVETPEGYAIEGAVRRNLSAQITVFKDNEGKVKRLAILTDAGASPNSERLGLDWKQGKVPTGVIFDCDVDRPLDWISTNCGTQNGIPYDSDGTHVTVNGKWPRTEDVNLLGVGLLNVYNKL